MSVEGSKNRKKIRKEKRREIVWKTKFFDEKPRLISNGNFLQNQA